MPSPSSESAVVLLAALLALFAPGHASADRGATTIDVGTGASLLFLQPPAYVKTPAPLPSSAAVARFGARYAFTNSLEVVLTGFMEPTVQVSHAGVTLDTSSPAFSGPDSGRGAFAGTLNHTVQRYGATAGARWIWGPEFRWTVGLDLGWSHRDYGELDHLEILPDTRARSYRLRISALSRDNLVVAPVFGLEWAIADKWSLSILPRLEFLLGAEPLVAVSVPLLFSYSWYL